MGILPPAAVVSAGIVISNGCVSLKSASAWRGKYILLYSDKFRPGMKLEIATNVCELSQITPSVNVDAAGSPSLLAYLTLISSG